MAEARDFTLILVSSSGHEGPGQLSRTLGMDESLAEQVCQTAPIILAEGLTKSDVKELSTRLAEASKGGLEFRVTARAARGLPRVHGVSVTGGGSGGGEVGFSWNNGAFVCPSCGESFLFQRTGPFTIQGA
jgi:hypothetical protein